MRIPNQPGDALQADPSAAAHHPTMSITTTVEEQTLPRIVVYQQTYFHRYRTDADGASTAAVPNSSDADGPKTARKQEGAEAEEVEEYISMLPLVEEACAGKITHVILAAIHLNEMPGDITLNDDPPLAEKHELVWEEMKVLQNSGIRMLAMLGGAAKGTYTRLDTHSDEVFEAFYAPLRDVLAQIGFDGIDLDVEERMSLGGIVRLILRLRRDFGDEFLITMAPVAAAMRGLVPDKNLSGFRYDEVEKAVGREIAWYNVQFYNGWGSPETSREYEEIADRGVFASDKLVLGCITNPEGGAGWVPDEMLQATLRTLVDKYSAETGQARGRTKRGFGGVSGWEYFNSITVHEPYGWHWSWANLVSSILKP